MARLPIMPIATDALLADTMHLSAEEFGAYMLILLATWRNNGNPLPDDDHAMACLARVAHARDYARLKPRLTQFFDISDGYWRQKRLEKMWDSALKISESYRLKAAKRWGVNRLKNNDTGDAGADARLMQPKPNIKERKSLKIRTRGKTQSGAANVAPNGATASPSGNGSATATPASPTLGPDETLWRTRLGWYLDEPASWHGNWGPPPTDPRCWLRITPDCKPYQPLLAELGLVPPPGPAA